ncbi:MAG TPA: hypothetical protein DCE23_02580 [Firmicutes bacterium]|nr:hypothetical protein [Bacillota bacterium]
MGKTIKDKVELEKIINDYLTNDIPLSLLTETYSLTYPQMQLLINRIIGYNRQSEMIVDSTPDGSYDELSESLLNLSHNFPEKYPKKPEEVTACFARLAEIKDELASLDIDKFKEELAKVEEELQSFDLDLIKRIESAINMLNTITDNDEITEMFLRNNINPKDMPSLNEMYLKYLSVKGRELELKNKIASLESHEKDLKSKKFQLEFEYEDIREDLLVCNVKLVNWCIRRFFNNIPLDKDEAQQYGIEGLIRAINRFDYTLSFHFSTFAVPVIVRNIESHFEELYGMSWKNFINKESIKYYRKLMRDEAGIPDYNATPQELADLGLMNLSSTQIANYDKMLDGVVPMSSVYPPLEEDIPATDKNDMPTTFEDYRQLDDYEDQYTIPAEGIDIEEETFNSVLKDVIKNTLDDLKPREREVLIMRFGLDGSAPKTLEEVGKHFGVNRERIRQIEAKAIRTLRHPRRSKELRPFYDDSYVGKPSVQLPDSKTAMYNKLITLLNLGKNQESLIAFMNMDNLNWTTETLNLYILFLQEVCREIREEMNDPDTEFSPEKLSAEISEQKKGYSIPASVIRNMVTKLDEIETNIKLYIDLYIKPLLDDDEEPTFGGK